MNFIASCGVAMMLTMGIANAQTVPSQMPTPTDNPAAGGPGAIQALLPVADVKNAQQKLKTLGLYQGDVDGIAGPDTRRAVSQFQQQRNLPESGELDQATMEALRGSGENQQQGSAPSAQPQGSAPSGAPGGPPDVVHGPPGATPPGRVR